MRMDGRTKNGRGFQLTFNEGLVARNADDSGLPVVAEANNSGSLWGLARRFAFALLALRFLHKPRERL